MRAKPKGIGDLAERVFINMGVAKVVKKIAGEDCGCEKRKEALNKLIPFRNANSDTEHTHSS